MWRGTRRNYLGLVVVVGWNYGPEWLFLWNSGTLVPMNALPTTVRLGQIDINRIIGVCVEERFSWGKLRIRVVYFKLSGRGIGPGRDLGFDHPQAKVLEDLFDDLVIFDEADDPHGPLTSGAAERVDFVDFLNQPGPVFSVRLQIFVHLQDTGNQCVLPGLSVPSAANIAVIAVVANHLFALVRHMGTQGRQPVEGVKR